MKKNQAGNGSNISRQTAAVIAFAAFIAGFLGGAVTEGDKGVGREAEVR